MAEDETNAFYLFKKCFEKSAERRREEKKIEALKEVAGQQKELLEILKNQQTANSTDNAIPQSYKKLTVELKPNDIITLAVAIKKYSVCRSTLKRKIQQGKIKSYRKRGNLHFVSEKIIAALFPAR
jgi:molybdopterin converting factor small subunit